MPNGYQSVWTNGEIKLLKNIAGTSLTSLETANSLCQKAFGDRWKMASFHDGGGWRFTAKGTIDLKERFWVYIYNQKANCWD